MSSRLKTAALVFALASAPRSRTQEGVRHGLAGPPWSCRAPGTAQARADHAGLREGSVAFHDNNVPLSRRASGGRGWLSRGHRSEGGEFSRFRATKPAMGSPNSKG